MYFLSQGLKTGYMELSLDIGSSYEESVRPKCVTQETTHVTIDMAVRQLINIVSYCILIVSDRG